MEQPGAEQQLQQALAAAAATPGGAAPSAAALSALLLERAAELAASAPARLQLQAALCASLLQSLADAPAAPGADLLARTWADAAPALAHICSSWTDEDVILGTISFVRELSAMLLGNTQQQQQQQQQGAYVAWLLALGEGGVAAVLQLLDAFHRLTHISHLTQEPRSGRAHVLLAFLQTGSSPAAHAAAAQLLRLARWPVASQQPCSGAAASAATALTAGEGFAACCQLLQGAAAALPRAEWQRMASAAGGWLRHAYSWADAPAAGSNSNGSTTWQQQQQRPDESLYDAFMLELLLHMLQGPDAALSTGGSAGSGDAQQRAAGAQQAAPSQQQQQQQQQQACAREQAQRWEAWAGSDGCGALCVLVASYDRPARLVRGLVAAQGESSTAVGAAADPPSAKKGGSSKVARAAMHKALELLHRVFMWHTHWPQSPAASPAPAAAAGQDAAARVQRLLAGLAELLRPQANCAVEWRAAGLQAMQEAVDDFTAEHPGDEALSCLWCAESVDGLLCCLRCDPSIKVRRAAVAVLQLVVLPQGCRSGRALVESLAERVCDNDTCVAASVLELLVQLPLGLLCGCVPARQFCAAVQASAELCCGGGGGGAAVVPAATRAQFLSLLRELLLYSGSGDACEERRAWLASQVVAPHTAQAWCASAAGAPVGLAGCRMLLLMMLQDPQLQGRWQRLQQVVVGTSGGGGAQ